MKILLAIYILIGLILTPFIYSNNANSYRPGTAGTRIGLAIAGGLYWPSYLFSIEPEVDGKSLISFQKSLAKIVEWRNDKLFTGTRTTEHGLMVIEAIGNCAAREGAGKLSNIYGTILTANLKGEDIDKVTPKIMKRMDGYDFLDLVKEGEKCKEELLKNPALVSATPGISVAAEEPVIVEKPAAAGEPVASAALEAEKRKQIDLRAQTQLQTDADKVNAKIPAGFVMVAPEESRQLLTSMLQQATSTYKVSEIKGKIEALAKPATGDRKTARKLNDQGLTALKADDFIQALDSLKSATVTDPADAEILNNYVYALIKAKRLQDAELDAGRLLTISPGRSSAWANLAEVYALKNKSEEAVAALVLAFQFSSNKDRTIAFLNEKASDISSPLQETAKKTIEIIKKL